MRFAERHPISDICILTRDIETSIAFYRDRLGFRLKHRAPGFADFAGAGLTLALWERGHLAGHTGTPVEPNADTAILIAVKMESLAEIEAAVAELTAAGVAFHRPPASYPWNAYGAYFSGPDGEVWELYAWMPGGAPGHLAEKEGGS
ncbi:MAG: VOC family protein [Ancalomicrobiaceae bacterium]|nr:VOC family protein [Ancalomicrobiaceae bacterium]